MTGILNLIPQMNNNTTFKMRRRALDIKQTELLKHASSTLGSGNLREAVKLPQGEDLNEWIAVNIVDFFNQTCMLYGTISEKCTSGTCPKMCAGPKYEYYWSDGHKRIHCSAPEYVDYLMTWVQEQLDDESSFPSQIGKPFPANFMTVAQTIMKRLFRIYAHIYREHFDYIEQLKAIEHLNTSFKHFVLFVSEFKLIEPKQLAPLQDLINKLVGSS
uniref:MOB kinase activator-like 1 n=1 Tax=Steinernema glaseri TaxID=37863 RepID=A0A1I7ZMK1_9BILA